MGGAGLTLSTRAWRRLSAQKRQLNPLCEDCEAAGLTMLATQVHHDRARSSGGQLLPALSELTSLCTPCHAKRTRAEVLRSRTLAELGLPERDPPSEPHEFLVR